MRVEACVNIFRFHAASTVRLRCHFLCVTVCFLNNYTFINAILKSQTLAVNNHNTTATCVITAWMLRYSVSQIAIWNFSPAWLQLVVYFTLLIWETVLLRTALQVIKDTLKSSRLLLTIIYMHAFGGRFCPKLYLWLPGIETYDLCTLNAMQLCYRNYNTNTAVFAEHLVSCVRRTKQVGGSRWEYTVVLGYAEIQ